MKKQLFTQKTIDVLRRAVDSQRVKCYIGLPQDGNSIYIEVENKPGSADIAIKTITDRILEDNPTLKLAQPVNLVKVLPMNGAFRYVSFIKFKKKPFWERLFSQK